MLIVIPYVWANTNETNLMDTFKEVMADLDKELEAIEPTERVTYVTKALESKAMPSYMKYFDMTADIKSYFEHVNSTKKNPWLYKETAEKGIWGARLSPIQNDQVMGQRDIIRIFGLSKFVVNQALDLAKSKAK